MPIDTSIYQQQPNLAGSLGDLVNRFNAQRQQEALNQNHLAQLAQQGELQNIQLQQARQQQADVAATRQAMAAAGGDISQAVPQLQRAGLYKQAADLLQQQRETAKNNMEFALKRHDALATVANDIYQSPKDWPTIVQNAQKNNLLTPEDAQLITNTYSGMTPEQIKPHALRGSIMAKDASSNIANMLYPKPTQDNTLVSVIGPDGVTPILVPRSQAAGMTPSGGKGAAEKPLTEFQGKAFSYGTRALDAHKVLDEIGTNYSPMATNIASSVENVPGLASLANAALSPKDQQIMQAQRNFVNAVLRQESGATISPSEFSNARKQYFPQPGDDAKTIAQKKANRERVIQNFKIESGPAASKFEEGVANIPSAIPAAATSGTGMTTQDLQAIQWAKANSNDPRAAKILQLHGM